MNEKTANLYEGPILKRVIFYTLPIMATGILQLLFNTADLVVVGQFCGSESIAAVGATGSLINLTVNLFMGLSVGAGVCVAHGIGAGHDKEVHNTIHTAFPLAIVCGLCLTVFGFFFLKECLILMDTPENILPLSTTYVRYYFLGITGSLVYNYGAAVLRAVGDTKSPLLYLVISGVINVILNLVFVALFQMNVAGVAIATTISQFVSAGLVLFNLMRRTDACHLSVKQFCFHRRQLFKMLRIGLPAGIQGCMFSLSNSIIQSSINSFGPTAVAGNSASVNIEGYCNVCTNAFSQTAMNFVGQTVGAGRYDRVKKIYGVCLSTVAAVGFTLGLLSYAAAPWLLRIYITDSNAAIACALERMAILCVPYLICGIMDVTTGTIRGMGNSFAPMVISMLGVCGLRVVLVYTIFQVPLFHTLQTIYISYPVTWLITFLAQLPVLFITLHRAQRKLKNAAVAAQALEFTDAADEESTVAAENLAQISATAPEEISIVTKRAE